MGIEMEFDQGRPVDDWDGISWNLVESRVRIVLSIEVVFLSESDDEVEFLQMIEL